MWQISIPMETYNKHFYSHIPCGMWRNIHTKFETIMEFLLTHPVWDVTLSVHLIYATLIISTHTSRVGCDLNVSFVFHNVTNFYSHIPCGMWLYASKLRLRAITFLLTHPVWDVTCPLSSYSCICQFLLTHPVWDVTQVLFYSFPNKTFLLTHPVWDVTSFIGIGLLLHLLFLLTHPVWDVTRQMI